jgi:tetratricopeptide (TPR) repeat protein
MIEPTKQPGHSVPLPSRHKRIVSLDKDDASERPHTLANVNSPSDSKVQKTVDPPLPTSWRRYSDEDLLREKFRIVEKIDHLHQRSRRRFVKAILLVFAALLVIFVWLDIERMGYRENLPGIAEQNKAQDSSHTGEQDTARPDRIDLSALQEKVSPSLVTVRRGNGQGSGFIIEGGLVVTAYHVAPNGSAATVIFQDGEQAKVVEHVAGDQMQDVSVLRIDTERELKPLSLASTMPAIGETVAGFQSGGGKLQGKVTNTVNSNPLSHVRGRELLLTTLNVVPGWSGSPVVDRDGKVIGIAVETNGAYFKTAQMKIGSGSVIVPVAVLRALLGIAKLTEAISLYPNDPERYQNRADYHHYMGDLEKAIEDYTKAIQLKPDYAEAYFNRGCTQAELDNFNEAIADYTMSIELGRRSVDVYKKRAAAYEIQNQSEKAVADYSEAILLQPKEATLYRLRGLVCAKKGDHDKAITDFTEALRLDPKNTESYCARGSVFGALQDFDKAVADFTEAIRLNPTLAEAYDNRGMAYKSRGNPEEAIADFTQVIHLNANSFSGYMNRASVYQDLGNNEKALADLIEAIRLRPDYSPLYYYRAKVYVKLNDFDRAITDLTKALRIDSNQPDYFFARGDVYANKQLYKEAIDDFSQAIRLNFRFINAYHARASAYHQLGNEEKAQADVKRAKELGYQPE